MPPTTPLPIAAAKVVTKMARSSMVASPDAGRRRAADKVGKVPGRAPQRALDAIGHRCVAAVEHGGEQMDDEVGIHARHAARNQLRAKFFRWNRAEFYIAPGRL